MTERRRQPRTEWGRAKFLLILQTHFARGPCEITGLPFDLARHPSGRGPFTPSLDQIVPGDTRLVCWIYNAAKGSGTHEDVLTLARALHDDAK